MALLIAIAVFQYGCTSGAGSGNTQAPTWEMKVVEQKAGPCPSEQERCLVMRVSYPNFTHPDGTFASALNKEVMRFILPQFLFQQENEHDSTSLNTAMEGLEREFMVLVRNEPQYANGWFTEIDIKPEVVNSHLVLKSTVSSFLGGAHPNSFLKLDVYDLATHAKIDWSDLVTDTTGFKDLAQAKFIEAKGLKAGCDFASEGYWFVDNKFSLPENFALTQHGFYFYWNTYEISSYASGATEMQISFQEADKYLSPALKKAL